MIYSRHRIVLLEVLGFPIVEIPIRQISTGFLRNKSENDFGASSNATSVRSSAPHISSL
jgi:hypothetical protein